MQENIGRVSTWPDLGVYDPPPRIRAFSDQWSYIQFTATCPRCHRSKHPHQAYTRSLRRGDDRSWQRGLFLCHCNRCKVRWRQPYSYLSCYGNWFEDDMIRAVLERRKHWSHPWQYQAESARP